MFMWSKVTNQGQKSSEFNLKTCKFQFGLIQQVWGSRLDVNLHHPQSATAGETSGPGTAFFFFFFYF